MVKEAEERSPLVQALLDPGVYPHSASSVEMVETHVSFIFFVGDFVYKVKKPVDFAFLDFTTLEKRRHYCRRELELNRRICPEVYIGVDEIREQGGRFVVGGPGRTVEYAVKMRRLPSKNSLEQLVKDGRVSLQHIERIASRVARFHRQSETGPRIIVHGDLRAVRKNVEENFAQTRRFARAVLPREDYDDLVAYSQAFMEVRKHVFQARAEEGRIRDCHGDLHVAQIFLETPPDDGSWDGISIIDCIEFNERFRCSDVTEDIAFLAMDLDFHGRHDLSETFAAAYARESGDWGVFDLLDFFKVYRAYVRGKVACFRSEDPSLPGCVRREALETARAYFRLSHSYTPRLPQPAIILVSGVTGMGKSTLAAELARRRSMVHISSDVTRKNLVGIEPAVHRCEPFMEGIYSPSFSDRTYAAMLEKAREHLQAGDSVILDGTFRRAKERRDVLDLAKDLNAEAWIVQCSLDEEEAHRRLERRIKTGGSVSDGRWELYHQQLLQWEPVREVAPHRHIILDTEGSPEDNVAALLRGLYESILSNSPSPPPPPSNRS